MIELSGSWSGGLFRGRDGVELAYRERGQGRPLVLLHGIFSSAKLWIDFGPGPQLVAHGRRVIAPDLRGHGRSTRSHDPDHYPPDVLADDGLALIEALELDDYDLGGYSLGGRITVRMLARGARPARAVVGAQGLYQLTATGETSSINRRVLDALINHDDLPPNSAEAATADWIRRSGGDPVALRHVLDSFVATPHTCLQLLRTPTLVIVGDQDPRRVTAVDLACTLPAATFAEVPGDHLTALAAQEFADVIDAFTSP